MNVLVYMLPIALALGSIGLLAFVWAVRNGQYEDVAGASLRVLADDDLDPARLDPDQGPAGSKAP